LIISTKLLKWFIADQSRDFETFDSRFHDYLSKLFIYFILVNIEYQKNNIIVLYSNHKVYKGPLQITKDKIFNISPKLKPEIIFTYLIYTWQKSSSLLSYCMDITIMRIYISDWSSYTTLNRVQNVYILI